MEESRRGIMTLIVCLAIPLVVGGISSLISMGAMDTFNSMSKPWFAPPAWLFPIAWTVLYILMGVASYLIYISDSTLSGLALFIYAAQLIFNFFWPIIFFNMNQQFFAMIWLIIMFVMIITLIVLAFRINLAAAICLIPLGLWSSFALCLNLSIVRLNM